MPGRLTALALAALAAAGAGCDGGGGEGAEAPGGPVFLASFHAWQEVPAGEDPWAALRPSSAACAPDGWGTELLGDEPSLTVNTGACGWLTVRQPSRAPVRAGDRVRVRVWHGLLAAPAPADALLAVRLDGRDLWAAVVPIPGEAALLYEEVEAPADAPEGAELAFHLHNHGANTWNLLEISVVPGGAR